MKFPRSLSTIRDLTASAHMGTPSVNTDREDPAPLKHQGTRAFPQMGTQRNVQNPLTQQVQDFVPYPAPDYTIYSEEKADLGGAPGTISQIDNWPSNPSISIPNDKSAPRSEQALISGDLNLGEPPARIWRGMPMRFLGGNTADMGEDANGPGYPWNGDLQHIDHIWAVRQAAGGGRQSPTLSDDNAVIPATFAGDAR